MAHITSGLQEPRSLPLAVLIRLEGMKTLLNTFKVNLANSRYAKIIGYFSREYYCPVCRNYISHFDRLPDYYFEMAAKHECIVPFEDAESLNIDNYSCPVCGASDRDRLYAIYLESVFDQLDHSGTYSFLDIAPSHPLMKFIKSHSFIQYRSADLHMGGVDDRLSVEDMSMYPDKSFDFFLCSHVLEHVEDDFNAMRELRRILKPDGRGIVMVPIMLSLQDTYEDPTKTTEAERWKYFGQGDHTRMYAKASFVSRLEKAGFKVEQLDSMFFGSDLFDKSGIDSKSVLYVVRQ